MPNDIPTEMKQNVVVREKILFHPIIDDRIVPDSDYYDMLLALLDGIDFIIKKVGNLDIIHAHYASLNSYAAITMKSIFGTPVVTSSFGRDINIGFPLNNHFKTWITHSYIATDYVVVPDEELKHKVTSIIETQTNRIIENVSVIPMPLDSKIFSIDSSKAIFADHTNKIVLTTINSCFTPEKGIDTILKAIALVRNTCDVFLYIAGDDDDDNKENIKRLKNLTLELNIDDIVSFVGYLPRSDVGKLLSITDIFIDARTQGNFSSVLLEAQFFNVPTIATNSPSSKKIINADNGLLFAPNDEYDLSFAISRLISDKSLLEQLKTNCRRWVDIFGINYSEQSCFSAYEKLFESFGDKHL